MPSKSLYWHTFGSFTEALREAGFDVPVGEERLERAIVQGALLAPGSSGVCRGSPTGGGADRDPTMLTEWQVYRMLEAAAPARGRRSSSSCASGSSTAGRHGRADGTVHAGG